MSKPTARPWKTGNLWHTARAIKGSVPVNIYIEIDPFSWMTRLGEERKPVTPAIQKIPANQADIEHIVHCVNLHDELVATLQEIAYFHKYDEAECWPKHMRLLVRDVLAKTKEAER